MFEMACGYELTRLVPGEGEYRSVKDEVLKDVLRYIFNQDEEGRFTSSIKEVWLGHYRPFLTFIIGNVYKLSFLERLSSSWWVHYQRSCPF